MMITLDKSIRITELAEIYRPDELLELLQRTYDSLEQDVQVLLSMLAAHNFAVALQKIHRLKGMCSFLGATQAEDYLARLEKTMRNQKIEIELIKEISQDTLAVIEPVRTALSNAMQAHKR